jgi:hypothetical protein
MPVRRRVRTLPRQRETPCLDQKLGLLSDQEQASAPLKVPRKQQLALHERVVVERGEVTRRDRVERLLNCEPNLRRAIPQEALNNPSGWLVVARERFEERLGNHDETS